MTRRRGRPSRRTETVEAAVISAARCGLSIRGAAGCAGISKSTLHQWLDDGERNGSGPYGGLARRWAAALAAWESEVLRTVAAGRRGWQAAAWRLERRFPDEWGRRWAAPTADPLPGHDGRVLIVLPDNGRGDGPPVEH